MDPHIEVFQKPI